VIFGVSDGTRTRDIQDHNPESSTEDSMS